MAAEPDAEDGPANIPQGRCPCEPAGVSAARSDSDQNCQSSHAESRPGIKSAYPKMPKGGVKENRFSISRDMQHCFVIPRDCAGIAGEQTSRQSRRRRLCKGVAERLTLQGVTRISGQFPPSASIGRSWRRFSPCCGWSAVNQKLSAGLRPLACAAGWTWWRRRRETHISAEPLGPQAPPRFSQADADERWPPGPGTSSRQGPQAPVSLTSPCAGPESGSRSALNLLVTVETLKKRSEFLRIRGGARWATSSFVLEAKPRVERAEVEDGSTSSSKAGPRFGFTVSKKTGSAVTRNKIRRRLKAAVAELAPKLAVAGSDYVLVARTSAAARPFASLLADLEQAFVRVNRAMSSGARREQKLKGAKGPGRPDIN